MSNWQTKHDAAQKREDIETEAERHLPENSHWIVYGTTFTAMGGQEICAYCHILPKANMQRGEGHRHIKLGFYELLHRHD